MERTCLITGATSGIGRETARALAASGMTVALVARDRARGLATRDALRAETGNPHVEVHFADMASQGQLRTLAAEVLETYPRLHVLINNAGAVYARRVLTEDGLETTFAVNHMAPFLLTKLLLGRLQESSAARVVNVNSKVHNQGRLDLDDLQLARGYNPMRAYGNTKLYNLLCTYELARRLAGTGVTANALHPGLVATNIGQNAFGFLAYLTHPFSVSVAEGAKTSIYLASSPEVEGVSGQYFDKQRAVPSSKASYDEEAARRLWDATEALSR